MTDVDNTDLRAVIVDLAMAVAALSACVQQGNKLAYSVPEVAVMVGLSAPAVRRLVARGVLARVPHTQRLLIARVELERWVGSDDGSTGAVR